MGRPVGNTRVTGDARAAHCANAACEAGQGVEGALGAALGQERQDRSGEVRGEMRDKECKRRARGLDARTAKAGQLQVCSAFDFFVPELGSCIVLCSELRLCQVALEGKHELLA